MIPPSQIAIPLKKIVCLFISKFLFIERLYTANPKIRYGKIPTSPNGLQRILAASATPKKLLFLFFRILPTTIPVISQIGIECCGTQYSRVVFEEYWKYFAQISICVSQARGAVFVI